MADQPPVPSTSMVPKDKEWWLVRLRDGTVRPAAAVVDGEWVRAVFHRHSGTVFMACRDEVEWLAPLPPLEICVAVAELLASEASMAELGRASRHWTAEHVTRGNRIITAWRLHTVAIEAAVEASRKTAIRASIKAERETTGV